jgi:GT2 family glycosyltransferase
MTLPDVSVIIATYDRGQILLDTLHQLESLAHPALEVLVIDQTPDPGASVSRELSRLQATGRVRWVRRTTPSITAAMNHGAQLARAPVLLYVDDDIRLTGELVLAHARAHAWTGAAIVAGQVIQPWEQPLGPGEGGYAQGQEREPDAFRFNASESGPVRRFIGCNVSMRRDAVFALGGFDENFQGAAYRFEADFSERAYRSGFQIVFDPHAGLAHLHSERGGTRRFRSHLRTLAPWHSVGRFYYCLLHGRIPGVLRNTLVESLRTVAARDHLRRPWWIPLSAVAELGGLIWAARLRLAGPRHTLVREKFP